MGIKVQGLEEIKKALDPKLFEKVHRVSVNEVVGYAFTEAKKEIKGKWNIDIKKDGKEWAFASKQTGKMNKRNGRMKIIKASQKKDYILIEIAGTPLNLSLFEYSWNMEVQSKKKFKTKRAVAKKKAKLSKVQQGRVRVKILKGQVTTLKSAFVATMNSGHRGIFQRKSNKPLPILEKRTISPQSMFKEVDFERILDRKLKKNLLKRFNHNLNRLSGGYWK